MCKMLHPGWGHLCDFLEKTNSRAEIQIKDCQGLEVREELTNKGPEFWADGHTLHAFQLCQWLYNCFVFVMMQKTVHLTMVNLLSVKLCLTKHDFETIKPVTWKALLGGTGKWKCASNFYNARKLNIYAACPLKKHFIYNNHQNMFNYGNNGF